MKKPRPGSDALRLHAEQRLTRTRLEERPVPASIADAAALVHELQLHQIELEMQNEELQRARAEADAARERFADLYDFAPVGYFTIARDSAIREANLTGAGMLGVEREGLLTRRFAAFLAEAERPAFNAAISAALDGRGPQDCGATLLLGKDAARPSMYVQITLTASPGADELRVVTVDATERRRAEDCDRISQKLEAIGQLAGGVAHDFNNLLTIIVSNCELALEDVAAGGASHDLLVDLKGAAGRAAALTRQLLAFSRKQVVRPRVVDLNALVRDAGATLRRLIGEDVRLVLSLAPDLGLVELDPSQFDQMVINLAVNARDAMPSGGTLTVSTSNIEVTDAQPESGVPGSARSRVRLTVADTGTGMDATTLEHVFEPFFTTKELGQGAGLGLSTVFGMVKGCGGSISVRSQPGAGAIFELDFPRSCEPASRPLLAEQPRPPVVKGTETILVVEDEPALLRIALRVLKSVGYTVLGASSGADAVTLCQLHTSAIHLALSDVVMPGMSGIVFGERLRGLHPETKTLFMSGYTADALGAAHGLAVELLNKPFTPDELKRKVREILDSPARDGDL